MPKVCGKCDEKKSLRDYHTDNSNPDGKHPYCKECRCPYNARQFREYYKTHKAERQAANRRYQAKRRKQAA